MLPRKSGIYRIVCLSNAKLYVGSACNMYQRQMIHLHHLRRGTHQNRHLQAAWNKYGEQAFVFSVVEVVPKTQLLDREQLWIDMLRVCNTKVGFNICRSARSSFGVKRSLAWCKAMGRKRAKRWIVTDPNGEEHTVTNLAEFCHKQQLSYWSMVRMAYGKLRRLNSGWRCRRAAMSVQDWQNSLAPQALTDGRFRAKSWLVTSPTGKSQVVSNMPEFCKKHGLLTTGMSNVARGRCRHHHGWTCQEAL